MELSQTEIAYAAGLVDGEGCINISSRDGRGGLKQYYSLAVIVSNNDRRMVDWLFRRWTRGHVCSRRSGAHMAFQWRIGGHDAELFLQSVLPFLVTKKEQAELAIAFRDKTRTLYFQRGSPDATEMADFKSAMHALKKAAFEASALS